MVGSVRIAAASYTRRCERLVASGGWEDWTHPLSKGASGTCPPKCPSSGKYPGPHLIYGSRGHYQSTFQAASRSILPLLHSSPVCPTQTNSATCAWKDCIYASTALLIITGHYITNIRNAHLLQFVHWKSQQCNKVTRRETNDCRVECTDDADRKHSYPLVQTCHYIARQHQRVSNTEKHSPSSSGRARSTNF